MSWNQERIYQKIIEVADKYGDRNVQQLKLLKSILHKADKNEVFNGLYKVFLNGEDNNYIRQQLAGILLYDICPQVDMNLTKIIRNCLTTYNLSVEQLPWYWVDVFGKQNVLESIEIIECTDVTPREIQSLYTMKWWVEGYEGRCKQLINTKK